MSGFHWLPTIALVLGIVSAYIIIAVSSYHLLYRLTDLDALGSVLLSIFFPISLAIVLAVAPFIGLAKLTSLLIEKLIDYIQTPRPLRASRRQARHVEQRIEQPLNPQLFGVLPFIRPNFPQTQPGDVADQLDALLSQQAANAREAIEKQEKEGEKRKVAKKDIEPPTYLKSDLEL